jgi:toxin HigB-1
MIVNFRDDWLRAFFVDDIRSRNIPPDLEIRVFRRQWRLIFKWDGSRGEATDVYLDDHSYK